MEIIIGVVVVAVGATLALFVDDHTQWGGPELEDFR
jgi:hypothetical protein